MIKFFRRIRYNFMETGKTGKYFKYVIGEIVLVVISILIALQINNWNEQQKSNKLEAEYYCRLLEDLEQDYSQFNSLIKQAQGRLKASNQALRLLQQKQTKTLDIGQQISMATKAIYIDFKPNNSTFEDLKSSNLSIIKDKSITKSLNTYYNNIESMKSIIMVNGQNAVNLAFAHDDSFANGETQASKLYGRFKDGMEKDVYDAIVINPTEIISKDMQKRLYNNALVYTSSNIRQLELYNIIKKFAQNMTTLLKGKCKQTND